MSDSSQKYMLRGVSASKEDVHNAIKNIDKGLFPKAFCKIVPDFLTGSDDHCIVMHADGAGTKSSLAYMYWKETGQSLTSWNSKFLQHVKFHWEKTNKGQTPQISRQIDRRIESSWKIQEETIQTSKKLDTETIQENLRRLKEKHHI